MTSSLRLALTRAIALTSIGIIVVAALFSGASAFIEAQERQDDLLESIGNLIQSGHLVDSGPLDDDVGEETLVIRQFSPDSHNRQVEALSHLPLGLHTQEIADHFWRLSIQEHTVSGSRFMVAQQTDIRNESAITGALYGFVPAVILGLTTEKGVSYLTVDDSGPGIPEEDLIGVFEPFNRGTLTSSESGMTGTGLGLSICREIATRLGGEVSLSNRQSGCLRFLYSQPLASEATSR